MRCENARERTELLRDGLLDPADASAVETHLRECTACRAFDASAGQFADAIGTTRAIEAPADLDQRVLDDVYEHSHRPRWPLAAAASALLAVGLFWGVSKLRHDAEPGPEFAAVSVTPAPILRLTIDDSGRARDAVLLPGEALRFLLSRADVIVRGTVLSADGDTLEFHIGEFLRGEASDLLRDRGIRNERIRRGCIGPPQWKVGEDVVLFLERTRSGDGLEVVRGVLGKQTEPIDGWLPLAVLRAFINDGAPSADQVSAMVDEHGVAILRRLQEVGDVRDVVDAKQVVAAAGDALGRLQNARGDARVRAAIDLSIALRFADPTDAVAVAGLQAAQPALVELELGRERDTDPFVIVRRTIDADPAWAGAVLGAHLDAQIPVYATDKPTKLPAHLADALRLLRQIDPTAAQRRGREVLAAVTQTGPTRDVLEVLLEIDHRFAGDEIVRRARAERWAKREQVIGWYAALLVRIDRPEARMLLRSALHFVASDPYRHTEFLTALGLPEARPARVALASAFVEEAERYDNAVVDGLAMCGRQAFFLRCHLACGGTLDDFAGWLPEVLRTEPKDRRGQEDLIRALETALDVSVLRWKRPSPADLDAAAAELLELLPR